MMNTTLKMWTYVAYQLIGGFEHETSKSEGLSGATGKVGYCELTLSSVVIVNMLHAC